jgi:sensor c-di-GMP phosphodiesterase-like protein
MPITIVGKETYKADRWALVWLSLQRITAEPPTLLRDADIAAVSGAKLMRLRMKFFDGDTHRQSSKRMHLENDLRRAIDCQEFVLHYQPIVALDTG